MDQKISLDIQDFLDLTAGMIIEKHGVKILLQDIGYDKMLEIIHFNMLNQ